MAVFFFTAHEKVFKLHAQPQTGAYSCLGVPLANASLFLNTVYNIDSIYYCIL